MKKLSSIAIIGFLTLAHGVSAQTNQQSQAAGKTVIIKEKSAEPAKPTAPVKKKEGDEFKEKPAQW